MKQILPSLHLQRVWFTSFIYSLLSILVAFKGRVNLFLLMTGWLLLSVQVSFAQDVLMGLTSAGGKQGVGTAFSIKSNGADFAVQKEFEVYGYNPSQNLCKGKDGNFYGMTNEGGSFGEGTIFKMTPTGAITILRSLGRLDGQNPFGSLIQGTDGSFYGTTHFYDNSSFGTIFKITSTGVFTILHNFKNDKEGIFTAGNLVEGSDGNMYGMTAGGGKNDHGTIFKMTKKGAFTILHHLNSATDGEGPGESLVQGNDGNFYGMAPKGGANSNGTIFRITPGGTFTVLRHLEHYTDGASPFGSLTKGSDGYLYGITHWSGENDSRSNEGGTIFRISTAGAFKVLHRLVKDKEGSEASGSLVLGKDGNFYGRTYRGGKNYSGTLFRYSLDGKFTVLRHSDYNEHFILQRGYSLVQGDDGKFYGMDDVGGRNGLGAVFTLTPAGVYSLLVEFADATKGSIPSGSLVQAQDGKFYGMTKQGGSNDQGTIFKICDNSFSIVKSLHKDNTGSYTEGSLIQGKDGSFYGMTPSGGTNNAGTIFKISPKGNLAVLHHFDAVEDRYSTQGSLVQGKDGNFYGINNSVDLYGNGTIFKMTPRGEFTLLHYFDPASDGDEPQGNLVQGNDGNFYGMNKSGGTYGYGTIFKITTEGQFTVIYSFKDGNDGSYPTGSLVQGRDGNFYGMTGYYDITIFKITPNGTFTILRNLDYYEEGGESKGSLVQGSDGSFFGLTYEGGFYNTGTIFKITSKGDFTVLRHLNPDTDGGNPTGSLIIQKTNLSVDNLNVTTVEETAKTITLRGSAPGSPLTFNIISKPKNGSLSGTGANRTYTPKANFVGTDSFTYNITWGCQISATKTVSISVSNVNDAPVLAAIGSKTITLGSALTFTATATDPDNGQTRTFSLMNVPTGATINTSTGAFSWTPTTAGTYSFIVKVTDNGSPVLSDEEQIQVTVTNSSMATIRINSGGEALNTSLGKFEADAYLNGSSMISTKSLAVTNTTDDELYQDYRLASTVGGSFGYRIPVPNGTYSVKLHFVELFHTTRGKRSFDVSVEGNAWLNNYDIFLAAGGAQRAVVASNIVKVTDGVLDLAFASILDRASISAIEVVPEKSGTRLAMNNREKVIYSFQGSLYPNPVSEKLTVKLSEAAEQISTTIIDLTGAIRGNNTHHRISSTSLEISVTSLPASVYFLQLQTEHGQQTFKFVKE